MSVLPDGELRRILREVWGEDDCALAARDGELDQNVAVDAGGRRSLLKVAHPAGDPGWVDMQAAALRHLEAVGSGVPVPSVIPTVAGAPWADVETADGPRRVWRLSWMNGRPLAEVRPRRRELLRDLGRVMGELSVALDGFAHPLLDRPHPWDPARGGWVAEALDAVAPGPRRALLERVVARWPALEERLAGLPMAVVHGDANDHNVVAEAGVDPRRVAGVFDFGDMVRTRRVCEPAVAAAYAAFGCDDPVAAVGAVVAGFHAARPLDDAELDVVGDLVRTRLAVSVVMSARRAVERPDDGYVTVSEAAAWSLLERLDALHPAWITARIRDACGRPPFASGPAVTGWIGRQADLGVLAPVLGRTLTAADVTVLDLSVGSSMLGADPANLETGPLGARIDQALARAGATVGVGRWNEARPIYLDRAFADGDHPLDEHRTIHMGLDLFVPPGTPVRAPLEGTVEAVADNRGWKDYGPVVLLRHDPPGAPRFWTLWGHLDPEVLERLGPGERIGAGEVVARVGAPPRNGDWPPHLHLQLVLDPLGRGHDVPGVAPPRERSTWKAWCPDPSVLCGLAPDGGGAPEVDVDTLVSRRRRRLGTGLSLSYEPPLHIVRGWRQFLYDADGRAFLDLYNNVPHVGHAHPEVVEAVQRQAALLDTNTRYLHEAILDYADALVARLPEGLERVWVVNSASEANELALRLARAHTGRREVVVQEAGYHGHTTTLVDVSPYKFDGPGGRGRPPWVEVMAVPDDYRGAFRREEGDAGRRYGEEVARRVAAMTAAGRPPGAFLAETCPSVGGQIMPPEGYLARAYEAVRAAGGICIADEVQTGFGRLGDAFWGFELQGVVPDVVVLGKPAGNGFPLGVVVATDEVARSFDTGMEFFSTFGGNPVACAAGLAVLRVVEREGLQRRAAEVGGRLLDGLRVLADRRPRVGDVRGRGLFVGVEFVADPATRTPAPDTARYVVGRLRDAGILTGTDGPAHNVLKLRGPLVVGEADVDRFLTVLDGVLDEAGARE